MSELEDFRKMKDEFFASDANSPLSSEQKKTFERLHYFPENPALRLKVKIDEFPQKEEISMQTSTGSVQRYKKFGTFRFEADGQPAQLTIYQNEHGFFLPFADSLAGKETYPAGRYLEPEVLPDVRFLVDFNLAYNPYCAYNEMWSCPITPAENRLKLPIAAGEKLYPME